MNLFFFQLVSSDNNYEGSFTSTLRAAAGNCYFEKCSFRDISSINKGGGIAITGEIRSAFILDSLFDKCRALEGGAIYINSVDQLIRFKTFRSCILKCYATQNYDAVYTKTYSSYESAVQYTSVYFSGQGSDNGGGTITLNDGTVNVRNTNVSQCKGPTNVAFSLEGKGQNMLHYSTIVDNNAVDQCIIEFSNSRMEIRYINFVSNAQSSNSTGMISSLSKSGGFIENSNFYSNSAKFILSSVKEISLKNIQADTLTYTGTGYVTENVKTKQAFSTIKLEHYGGGGCHADIGVYRSDALRIAGYCMIGISLLLFVVLIVVWCVTGRSRMKEVLIEN